MALKKTQTSGFWIVCADSSTCKFILLCCIHKSERETWHLGNKKLQNGWRWRLQEEPPSTYCRIDWFGLFVICSKRKELKRFGFIFTCLCSHAIHLENSHSLGTDSFFLVLQRFKGRRRNSRPIRFNNGSNFVRAVPELWKSFQDMDDTRINEYLQMHEAHWLDYLDQ